MATTSKVMGELWHLTPRLTDEGAGGVGALRREEWRADALAGASSAARSGAPTRNLSGCTPNAMTRAELPTLGWRFVPTASLRKPGVLTSAWSAIALITPRRILPGVIALMLGSASVALAQIDPRPRSLLQLGFDQSLPGQGPQSLYAYYYYNNPELLRTNLALRLAVAPVYFDGEIGFRQLLSPHTDVGIGINGGGYGENHYEVRQGRYLKGESFDGHGGGASLNLYHLFNPAHLIPLHLVAQGGAHYSTYSATDKTDDSFALPGERVSTFARAGLRFAGKEPMLYPDLAMEMSVWWERQWRSDDGFYGLARDRRVQPTADRYWLYAGLSYAWTNTGHQFTFALTAGGSDEADRFSAWRLGGVLPLAAEFPLSLPGYYYQEISARRFAHGNASYVAPLSADHRWQLRLGAASAYVDYLPGFEQPGHWHTGVGPSLSFTSQSEVWRVILRYGYGFNALRDGHAGAHSVGVLYQYNFEQRKHRNKKFH